MNKDLQWFGPTHDLHPLLPNTQFGVPLQQMDYKEIYKAISNLFNENYKDLTKPRVYKG